MTPADLGRQVKQKYPGIYDQYPDDVVGQRTLTKYPEYQSMIDSSMGDVVKQAGREALATVGGYEPDTQIQSLETNPITQAKALPSVAGAAGAVTGIPMGASLGTGAGNLLADAALKSYGQSDQIPSVGSQVLGTGVAAAGDLTAIPAINRKIFGSQIGNIEASQGVPPPQDIPSLPKPAAGQPVSGGIDDTIRAVAQAKSQGAGSPVFWKQIKDQIDAFYNAGKDVKLTQMDQNKLAFLSDQVQNGLNASVPGRAVPAASLAMSQTVPNALSGAWNAVPWWGRAIIGEGALQRALAGMSAKKQ